MLDKHLKRERQQAVAGEDRGRFAKFLVARRQAATQVVIIHRGQIVVDERVCVNHLDGGGRGGRLSIFATRCSRRHEHEDRPQSFTGREQTVAHRFDKGSRGGFFGSKQIAQICLDKVLAVGHRGFEVQCRVLRSLNHCASPNGRTSWSRRYRWRRCRSIR